MSHVRMRLFAVAMVSLTTVAGCTADTTANDSTEGTGESQDHLLTGRRLSEKEAATLIRRAGFPDSVVGKLLCTIKYESNFYERASNRNSNGSVDYGLFQVNSLHLRDAGCPSTPAGLYDASANTKCALGIYRSQGIDAWYGYQKHRSECDRYPAPTGSAATPMTADDPTDTSADGGCYSGTLDEMEPASTCVESKFDQLWYQCQAGHWLRGGDTGSGPNGTCSSKHPL